MAKPRVLVLRAPGANCDEETQHAFELAGGMVERIHVNRLLEAPNMLDEFQILCIPGGFTYGDDVAAGRILASIMQMKLGDRLRSFRDHDRLILGVCNGFQVLLRAGLLIEPDRESGSPLATLMLNRNGRFEDRWVHLKLSAGKCEFIKENEIIAMPIAHGEGNFTAISQDVIDELEASGQVVAKYVDASGNPGGFPINPNGSMNDIAGVCDRTGRVFALMPHPERHLYAHQHPQWTRRTGQAHEKGDGDVGDGRRIFENAVRHFS